MAREDFLSGLSDKIPLDAPKFWDIEEFHGYDRIAVSRGNTALQRIFEETETKLPRLIASVRWSLLRMPYKDFAISAGISPNGYVPMEKDPPGGIKAPVHRSKYTRLLQHWKQEGISSGIREQLLDLLTNPEFLELHPSCTDLLSAIEYVRKESKDLLDFSHITAFYHRIGYDVGHAHIEKKFPAFFNTVWQREKTQTVPPFLEMKNVIDTMYAGRSGDKTDQRECRLAQAEAVWTEAQRKRYAERTVEPPMAEYLTGMEKYLAIARGTTLTTTSLREERGHTPLHAERLIQTEYVPDSDIESDIRLFMDEKQAAAFFREWNQERKKEEKRMSFGKLYSTAMEERGFTAADIASLVGVKAPEERGGTSSRIHRFRSDSGVRGVLFQHDLSNQISIEALVQVVAKNPGHADTLRQAYCEDRTRFFRRTGHSLHGQGLTMRLWRELANVSMNDLAKQFSPETKQRDKAAAKKKNLELQKLERQEGKSHSISFDDVLSYLGEVADERAKEALVRLQKFHEVSEELKSFSSVQEMAANLVRAMKGANNVSESMRDSARNDSDWLRADLITRMMEGTYVSALPPLRIMAKSTIGSVLPPEVVRDWYGRFPAQLTEGVVDFGKVKSPLARVLCTLIAAKEANPIRFFRDRVPGVAPTIGTKHLRELDTGTSVDWKHIHKYLLATGIKPGALIYRFAKELHQNGGNVKTAIGVISASLTETQQPMDAVSLPGLLSGELPAIPDKK